MIEQLSGFPDNVAAFICREHVTKDDYDSVLVPAVIKVLEENRKARLYYEIAPDFSGIDLGAAWEDFKVGMEHLTRWEKIAVVADVEWIKNTIRLFAFMMPAAVKTFPTTDAKAAQDWICRDD
jgi:SpoIIAA-like